jgi:hypothetical protein
LALPHLLPAKNGFVAPGICITCAKFITKKTFHLEKKYYILTKVFLFCGTNSVEIFKALSNYKNIKILFDWICKLFLMRKKDVRKMKNFMNEILLKYGAYRLRREYK